MEPLEERRANRKSEAYSTVMTNNSNNSIVEAKGLKKPMKTNFHHGYYNILPALNAMTIT